VEYQTIREYVIDSYRYGSLREVIINTPKELLPINTGDCIATLNEILSLYHELESERGKR
jgi:hypothetical protein